MDIYKINNIYELIHENPYVGRGIVIGKTPDGKKAASAYFIMGRSSNSRNRVFTMQRDVLYTEPYDINKVEDPSLIIYAAVRHFGNKLILTNGDQTDTIVEGLKKDIPFSEALSKREFEPDAPNFTPRISGMLTFDRKGDFSYEMNILKSIDEKGTACCRQNFFYPSIPGLGHFIHTYVCDGSPIPTFTGEPERVEIDNNIDDFASCLWRGLNEDNKISLYVSYTDLTTLEQERRIINKYHGEAEND